MLRDMNITVQANSFPTHQGNPPDYRGVPFSLTEEFVSVYRMHSLLPDIIAIRRMNSGKDICQRRKETVEQTNKNKKGHGTK